MFINSDNQQVKEVQDSTKRQRVARIMTVFKFMLLLALCLMVLAPWLAALLSQL